MSQHLAAAFCSGLPAHDPTAITALCREIMPLAAPRGTYSTVSFTGGYVGFAGADEGRGIQINFSIWGDDATPVAPADPRFGVLPERQFSHEGTGWAGRLAFPWQCGEVYRVFVSARHADDQTVYSAWLGCGETWLLAGRIRKAGTHYLRNAGGFIEHVGQQTPELVRATAFGRSWVFDDGVWHPCRRVTVLRKDPLNADFYQASGFTVIRIGLGLTNAEPKTWAGEVPTGELPQLPEPAPSPAPGLEWSAMRLAMQR